MLFMMSGIKWERRTCAGGGQNVRMSLKYLGEGISIVLTAATIDGERRKKYLTATERLQHHE